MKCLWCGNSIRACPVQNCRGWNREPCGGYMHWDLFHGCDGGAHQAEWDGQPASKADTSD